MLFHSVYSSFIKIPQNHKNSLNRAGVHTKPKVGVLCTMGHILVDVCVCLYIIPRLVFCPSCSCYHFTPRVFQFSKVSSCDGWLLHSVLRWCNHHLGVLLFTIIACCNFHGVTALHLRSVAWQWPYSSGTILHLCGLLAFFGDGRMATLATLLLIIKKSRPF